MVTNKLCNATNYVELEGVSDDDKPTENIGVNSKFLELDTGKQFYFDGESWAEIGGET